MNKSQLGSFLEDHEYSDLEGYRNFSPESSNISAILKNNPDYDLFCTNNIMYQSCASSLIDLSNDQFCNQNNPQTDNDQIASKRANNTIFKTSASQFRKSINEYVRKYYSLSWVYKKLKQTLRINNLSLFPKLLAIVKQLDIQSQIGQIWKLKSSQILEKKQKLMKQGKFSSTRFKQLQKSIMNMNECINQTDIIKALDIYWGNYKQTTKYEKCKRELLDYQQQLKRLKSLHEEKQLKEKKLKEQTLPIKNPQSLEFQNDLIAFSYECQEQDIFSRLPAQFQKQAQ